MGGREARLGLLGAIPEVWRPRGGCEGNPAATELHLQGTHFCLLRTNIDSMSSGKAAVPCLVCQAEPGAGSTRPGGAVAGSCTVVCLVSSDVQLSVMDELPTPPILGAAAAACLSFPVVEFVRR